jgi:phenylalanyl-tRNA synthetase beta chain
MISEIYSQKDWIFLGGNKVPTVTINYNDLCNLLREKISLEKLEYALPLIKCEIKTVEDGEMVVEINTDRPDMLSTEGIVRSLKGFLGIETGYPKFQTKQGRIMVNVTEFTEKVRPFIACVAVRNVKLTDDFVKQLMQLQEKLHETLSRRRRKASIGVYDLDKIRPPIIYTALKPNEIKFVPLEETKPMTANEILERNTKGIEYGYIIKDMERYPLLVDSKGTVLSMPPIINCEETKVTVESENLFIDATGLSEHLVNDIVNILAANIAERGAIIESVRIAYPHRTVWTGTMKPEKMTVNTDYIREVSGLNTDPKSTCLFLKKMRFDAKVYRNKKIEVIIPPYRCDILHPIDIVEDVIIGYGYDNVEPEIPQTLTFGKEIDRSKYIRKIRDLMVGFGFQEIMSYLLTSKEDQISKMGLKDTDIVELANPMTSEYSVLRKWIIPCILRFLSLNTHVEYPQKIFECGDIIVENDETITKTRQETRLAGAICDDKVSYEDIQAVVYGLLQNLAVKKWKIQAKTHPSFIEGRTASILFGKDQIAILGEIHPQVLVNFGIRNSTVAFEINLNPIFESYG